MGTATERRAGRTVGRLLHPFPHGSPLSADQPLADQQALYTGFGNALGQAVEIVATPFLFFLLGLWLDHAFGTGSILRVTLFVVALVGVGVTAYYRYQAAMDEAEEGKPWKR